MPWVCEMPGGCSPPVCFPASGWGWGTALLVLRGEKNWTKLSRATELRPTTTWGWEIVSPVIPFAGQKARMCSPGILTTGCGVLCCYPCFTFKGVEVDLIKAVQSRSGRTGCGGFCLPVCWALLLSRLITNDQLQEGGTQYLSLLNQIHFQLQPQSSLSKIFLASSPFTCFFLKTQKP